MPHIISYFFVSLNNSAYLCSVLPILFIMIIDKLENADRYFGCGKGLKEAFAFLINNELEDLPNCKIKLDGNEVYLTISTLQCKAISDCHLEAHKDYIDIQLLVSGKEKIGWKPQENCDDVFKEYDEQTIKLQEKYKENNKRLVIFLFPICSIADLIRRLLFY